MPFYFLSKESSILWIYPPPNFILCMILFWKLFFGMKVYKIEL